MPWGSLCKWGDKSPACGLSVYPPGKKQEREIDFVTAQIALCTVYMGKEGNVIESTLNKHILCPRNGFSFAPVSMWGHQKATLLFLGFAGPSANYFLVLERSEDH